jgi:hypothetical protein
MLSFPSFRRDFQPGEKAGAILACNPASPRRTIMAGRRIANLFSSFAGHASDKKAPNIGLEIYFCRIGT